MPLKSTSGRTHLLCSSGISNYQTNRTRHFYAQQFDVVEFYPSISEALLNRALDFKSKIGREFLRLVDKCFPAGHKLRKILNRNTLKLSYSCMPNVQQIINGHNQTGHNQHGQAERACNCQKKEECSLEGNCLSKGIVYQAQVTSASKTV